jgi:hypothetical protein
MIAVFGGLVLGSVEVARSQCPTGLYYADLVHNQQANFLPAGIITGIEFQPNVDPDCPGTRMLKVAIDLPAACTKVVIWVQFDGEPSGWTLNVGDSPTNNGFGGDSGTASNAELQILNQNLAVYNAATVPQEVDQLAFQNLVLANGALNVIVENQKISWGQPYSALQSFGLERLFAIPDTNGDARRVYLGVNRVVANTSRTGCGARRALISLLE